MRKSQPDGSGTTPVEGRVFRAEAALIVGERVSPLPTGPLGRRPDRRDAPARPAVRESVLPGRVRGGEPFGGTSSGPAPGHPLARLAPSGRTTSTGIAAARAAWRSTRSASSTSPPTAC
ncbi:hypothetical protein [Streptomyces sp. TE5632]